jgi:hypothetical protein
MDHTMTLNGPEDLGGTHHPFFVASRQPASPGLSFYGQNIAMSSKASTRGRTISPASSDGAPPDTEIPRSHTGRFTAEIATQSNLKPSPSSHTRSSPFISHSFAPEQAVILKSSVVEPWNNPAFPPLPVFMLNRLRLMNSVEIPSREAFTAAFRLFLDNLVIELKETTCLSPDVYSRVAVCLRKGDLHELSERLRIWISFHRLCSGSEKYFLVLAPRDAALDDPEAEFEKLRRSYCQKVDNGVPDDGNTGEVGFDRLPLQPQVYDILSYVHRTHAPVPEMLREVDKLGFVSTIHDTNAYRLGVIDIWIHRTQSPGQSLKCMHDYALYALYSIATTHTP